MNRTSVETGDIRKKWKVFLESPVAAHPFRQVGEDEFRFPGSVSAAGLNLLFSNSNTPVDLEILEVTLQPQSQVNAQLGVGGTPIGGLWTLSALQFASLAGFILERGKQITITLSTSVLVNFEVRFRLYYGRQTA